MLREIDTQVQSRLSEGNAECVHSHGGKALLTEGSEASSHKEAATYRAKASDRKLSFPTSTRSLSVLYRLKCILLAS